MADPAQDAWVLRVLGVSPGKGRAASRGLLPIWVQAKDEIDTSIGKLQAAIRATGDVDLVQIAEYGLSGATTGRSVKLMAALRDAEAAGAKAKLTAAIEDFRAFLDGNPVVALLESNPFGVSVPIRTRLGAALNTIENSVTSA